MKIEEYTPYGLIDYFIQKNGLESLFYCLFLKVAQIAYENPKDEYPFQLIEDLGQTYTNYQNRNNDKSPG